MAGSVLHHCQDTLSAPSGHLSQWGRQDLATCGGVILHCKITGTGNPSPTQRLVCFSG